MMSTVMNPSREIQCVNMKVEEPNEVHSHNVSLAYPRRFTCFSVCRKQYKSIQTALWNTRGKMGADACQLLLSGRTLSSRREQYIDIMTESSRKKGRGLTHAPMDPLPVFRERLYFIFLG